jgi:hypothetical protein
LRSLAIRVVLDEITHVLASSRVGNERSMTAPVINGSFFRR